MQRSCIAIAVEQIVPFALSVLKKSVRVPIHFGDMDVGFFRFPHDFQCCFRVAFAPTHLLSHLAGNLRGGHQQKDVVHLYAESQQSRRRSFNRNVEKLSMNNRSKSEILQALELKVAETAKLIAALREADEALFDAAVDCFESPLPAGEFLISPAAGLAGKIPIEICATPEGREQVIRLLRQMDRGTYL